MNSKLRNVIASATLLAATTVGVATHVPFQAKAAGLAPIPSGLPTHFGYGLFNSTITDMHPSVPYDYRYQYLAGGVNTGGGWQTWGSNYAQNYVSQSRQRGYIPGFIYYNILQSAPSYDEYSNLQNASTMRSYYDDFKALLQQMNDATGQAAFINVEPDLDGVMMQHPSNTGDNAALQPAKVGGSGMPELAGMADNFRNYWQALAHLRDLYAPNVVLGQDLSIWGADYDLTIALRNDPNYNWQLHADRTATYHNSFGPGYSLNFFSPLDRDAAYYQIQYGSDRWWHMDATEPNFDTIAAWLGRIDSATNKRALMWQVPNGNQLYRSENNTSGHYQDNRPEYFLNSTTGRQHMSLWANYGVIGLMFGAGVGSQSHYFDSNGDGITNPAPINGNNLTATVPDDDGGYIRSSVSAYYSSGALTLPGAGSNPSPTATSTSTPIRTNTPVPPTNTPTRTPTQAATGTAVPPTTTRTATPRPSQTATPAVTNTPLPTATATPGGATSPVYNDALRNGWQNWSWRSTVNLANTSYAHSGTKSISVAFNSAWAGLQLGNNTAFSTSGYSKITFWINGGANSGQRLEMYLADRNGNYLRSVDLDNYINGGSVARNTWRQVTVPLADLGASNTFVTGIVLQDTIGSAQPTFYVDDFQFGN